MPQSTHRICAGTLLPGTNVLESEDLASDMEESSIHFFTCGRAGQQNQSGSLRANGVFSFAQKRASIQPSDC